MQIMADHKTITKIISPVLLLLTVLLVIASGCDSGRKSMRELMEAAEEGDAEAQCRLGEEYKVTPEVEGHEEKAAEWWRKAAVQGHPRAQHLLGLAYGWGKGLAEDNVEFIAWVSLAADNGYKQAEIRLEKIKRNLSPESVQQGFNRAEELRQEYPEVDRSAALDIDE